MAKAVKPKRTRVVKEEETTKDLIATLDIVEELNKRVYDLETKFQEQSKLYNLTTNTINYIMANLYVYESYLFEMGVDPNYLKQEIEQVFYDAFNRQNKNGKKEEYSNNIIKKVNDQLRIFQEKLNEN